MSGNKLARFVILITAICSFTLEASSQIITDFSGVRVNWSEGVVTGVGVGRSSYDSSIARPSKETHFDSAKQDATRRLTQAIAGLWATTPLYRTIKTTPKTVAQQALTAFPAQIQLFSDGSVHASFKIPLSTLDVSATQTLGEAVTPIVLEISPPYAPTLGLIWCYAGETRSIPQARITHHQSERELPTFLRGGQSRRVAGQYNADFQCLSLKNTHDTPAAWSSLDRQPRVYVVHKQSQSGW